MRLSVFSDEYYMQQALNEALAAEENDEVPVGAVIVCNDKIISRAHNQVEQLNDVTAHAEMLALTSAFNNMGAKYLDDCTLYVTLEPCVMCAGALIQARIKKVIYGAKSYQDGAIESALKLYEIKGFNHYPETMYFAICESNTTKSAFSLSVAHVE